MWSIERPAGTAVGTKATLAAGSSVSNAVDCRALTRLAYVVPADLDADAYQVTLSIDGKTFFPWDEISPGGGGWSQSPSQYDYLGPDERGKLRIMGQAVNLAPVPYFRFEAFRIQWVQAPWGADRYEPQYSPAVQSVDRVFPVFLTT